MTARSVTLKRRTEVNRSFTSGRSERAIHPLPRESRTCRPWLARSPPHSRIVQRNCSPIRLSGCLSLSLAPLSCPRAFLPVPQETAAPARFPSWSSLSRPLITNRNNDFHRLHHRVKINAPCTVPHASCPAHVPCPMSHAPCPSSSHDSVAGSRAAPLPFRFSSFLPAQHSSSVTDSVAVAVGVGVSDSRSQLWNTGSSRSDLVLRAGPGRRATRGHCI